MQVFMADTLWHLKRNHAKSDKFELSRLKSHQLETLSYYTKLGHIAFLFLSFSEQDFYILPYEVISAVITKKTDSIQWGNITQPVSRYKHIKKARLMISLKSISETVKMAYRF